MTADETLERALRDDWARLVALLLGQFGRPDLVEDALADAFAGAVRRWPVDGVPANPSAWLLTAARHRVVDHLRTEAVHRRRHPLMVVDARTREAAAAAEDPGAHVTDEVLRLVLTCCHPALAPEARIALTLRFVIGLDVPDIARLLLVQDATMAARLTRAKKRLATSGIPFVVPGPDQLDERLDVVATVLYLMFTAGYHPADGPRTLRVDLGDEAIRLAHELDAQLGGSPVLRALLALMLLQHSRRRSRLDEAGRIILLSDQDRAGWDLDDIRAGTAHLAGLTRTTGQAEEYRLQALIAAEHASAPAAAATRWSVIAEHYADLEELTGSPVVRLARAVAVAEAAGPDAGLALLDGMDERLPRHHRLAAVRGELLTRAGRLDAAVEAFRQALDLVANEAERTHLRTRLAQVEAQQED